MSISTSEEVSLTRSSVQVDSILDGTFLLGISLRDSSKGMLGLEESHILLFQMIVINYHNCFGSLIGSRGRLVATTQ